MIKCIEELIKIHQIKVLLKVNKKALKGIPEEIDELEVKIKLPNNLTKKGFRLYFKHDLKYGPVTQPGRVPAF